MIHIIKTVTLVVEILTFAIVASGAEYRTRNFHVTAPTPQFAQAVAEAAEEYRVEKANEWLGKPLAGNWSTPCKIKCKVGDIGAGGVTTFSFNNGHVFGWDMWVQGTEQRILDSVIPHEVTHTIFACHYRGPMIRWADEGAATLEESESERMRQIRIIQQVDDTRVWMPIDRLLTIREYPKDDNGLLQLYAQGYSLSDFLVNIRGKRAFLDFVEDGMQPNKENGMSTSWTSSFRKHYAFKNLQDVESNWTVYRRRGHQPFVAQWDCNGSCGPCPVLGPLPPNGSVILPWSPQPQPVPSYPPQPVPVPTPNPTPQPTPVCDCPDYSQDINQLWEAVNGNSQQIEDVNFRLTSVEQNMGNVLSRINYLEQNQIDIDEIVNIVLNRIGDNTSPPPSGGGGVSSERHFVVIANPDARYFTNLAKDVESTKGHFDAIELIEPPTDRNVGTLPMIVLYVDGTPAFASRGTSQVDRMLSRIRRGEFN